MATAASLHPLETRQKGVLQEIRSILLTVPTLPALFAEEWLMQKELCLRALLVLLAGETAAYEGGAGQEEALLTAACAIELLHLGFLAHEQIADGTVISGRVLTRSVPLGPLEQIWVGDYWQAKGTSLLAAQYPAPEVLSVFQDLTEHFVTEKLRVREHWLREEWSERAYLERVYAKSAVLLASCCKLGALVAGGSSEAVEALTSYGYALGMALQIEIDLQATTQAAVPNQLGMPPASLHALAKSYGQKAKGCLSALPASLTKYWLLHLPEQLDKKGLIRAD